MLGCIAGIAMGLVPGIHPNLILLVVPLLMAIEASSASLLVFIVAMAVVNSLVDFVPSLLLGAPDSGSELSVLPGHNMLLKGYGYSAVKLTLIGGIGSVLLCLILMPGIMLFIPYAYAAARPYMHVILIFFITLMIIGEKKKLTALLCLALSGAIGLMIGALPLDSNLVLFPIFTGFFGLSMLILQMKNRTTIPEQHMDDFPVSRKTVCRSVAMGTAGGIFSGLLPGVGSSQIASFASTDKNDSSFLITIGAITAANIILSLLALWLISNPRSGVAMAVDQLMSIGFSDFILIVVVSLISCCIGCIATLFIARKLIKIIQKINYSRISLFVAVFLVITVFLFTGVYGLFLAGMCCCLGIFTNISGIRRSNLMGVLLIPTILFFIGL